MLKEVSSFEFQVSSESAQGGQLDAAKKLDGVLGLTLAQVLKRPEVRIEALAPLLARLMPGFFERGGRGQGLGASENSVPLTVAHAVIPSERQRVEGPAVLAPSPYPLTPDFRLPTEIRNELKSVETEIKYSGYLDQQSKAIERLKRSEQRLIPDWFDYARVSGLSREMNEKLTRVRPRTLGQASRIPGVTPAAVSLINVYIEIQARQQAAASSLG
jgi:tRNA uridine 5-carboxymethylaminomethyl modification enzyme